LSLRRAEHFFPEADRAVPGSARDIRCDQPKSVDRLSADGLVKRRIGACRPAFSQSPAPKCKNGQTIPYQMTRNHGAAAYAHLRPRGRIERWSDLCERILMNRETGAPGAEMKRCILGPPLALSEPAGQKRRGHLLSHLVRVFRCPDRADQSAPARPGAIADSITFPLERLHVDSPVSAQAGRDGSHLGRFRSIPLRSSRTEQSPSML